MKLRTENIRKSYKGRQVVKGVTIEVNRGEIVGLLGPNGAGKTTSFYMIVGLVRPLEGNVYLDDEDITRFPMYRRAQMGIGYLPQEVSVFRKLSVEDNISLILEMTDLSKEEQKKKLERLLDEFGLQQVRKNLGQSLSGGEKRRTEIARALATDPKFILLDEPFAGVDPIAVEDIQKIVAELKKRNIGVLITDHNVQETLAITDRTYLLFEGDILREGTAEELAADPMVRKVYLGENFKLRKRREELRSDTEEGKKEIDKTDRERHVEYVDNVLNIAQKTLVRFDQKNARYIPGLAEERGVDDLILAVNELKSYFQKGEFSAEIQRRFVEIDYGPVQKYQMDWKLVGLEVLIPVIPFIGWGMYIVYRRRIRRCVDETKILISQLESIKQLVKNPELEEMI